MMAPGNYTGLLNSGLDFGGVSLTIKASAAGVILDAAHQRRIFTMLSSNVTLEGLTLSRGSLAPKPNAARLDPLV